MQYSLSSLYGIREEALKQQQQRFQKLKARFEEIYAASPQRFFSAPGRTEIGGNHTDHNQGIVLAGSVQLDAVAAVRKNKTKRVRIFSEEYDQSYRVDLSDLEPKRDEVGTTTALIRGIAARFVELGYHVGGFDALISSDVLPGSGLSSSAAIEVLLGTIWNGLDNEEKIPPETIAAIGQYSENYFFGKPCGLMDQTASALGGVVRIDFVNPEHPHIEKIPLSLEEYGYKLLIVNTGGSHANLTPHYAAIPNEMKKVANFFRKEVLRQVSKTDVFNHLAELRKTVGDRALLRALHFFEENERVQREVEALQSGQFDVFLREVQASGNSSWKWLQNVTVPENSTEQNVALALAITEDFLKQLGKGACRVHGGGFAGTIQAFMPREAVEQYRQLMEKIFGQKAVFVLTLRSIGAAEVTIP